MTKTHLLSDNLQKGVSTIVMSGTSMVTQNLIVYCTNLNLEKKKQ